MKTKCKDGGMILQIDFKKAYDKVNQKFIEQTLIDFNFPNSWAKLIMFCVTLSPLVLKVNGQIIEFFKPGRVLRQGDPLSPYIFMLCMERLSNMINVKVLNGDWKGLKASQSGPIVSHLFFADDILLFSKANVEKCKIVMETLEDFCDISGQSINLQKSVMFVSPNIFRSKVNAFYFTTHIPI